MKKKIVPLFLSLFLILSNLVFPSYASPQNYNVYAFRSGNATQNPLYTHILPRDSTWIYGGTFNGGKYFGFVVELPPSSVSGYIIVAGIFPVRNTDTTTGWKNSSSSSLGLYPYTFYLSSELSFIPNTATGAYTDSGIIYVPAHSSTLYLYGCAVTTVSNNTADNAGAMSLPSSFVAFVPDSDQSASVLQQILTQVTNIKNEITSSSEDNLYSQEIVDQMDDLLEQIEDLTQQIEDVTVRPPPDTILPSPPADLLPPVDPAGQLGFEAVTSILSLPLILSFLLMVFTLALIRYVLFGKSQ